jgi:cytochrome P450
VRTLDVSVRAAADALVAALPSGEAVDVVPRLSVPLPIQVIAQLLGLPDDRWDDVWAWSEAAIPGTATSFDAARAAELRDEMGAELARLVAEARAEPRDTVIGQLATTEVDGDRLSDAELSMFLVQLLVAGNETTRTTITGALVALAQHQEQWSRLVAEPSLVPSAVEEVLRWTTPVIYFMRTATCDTVLGGVAVAAGDPVVMVYASANRDEGEFGPTAATFDVGRSPNNHVAFGFGAHFCLGAALARLEAAAVLDALLARGVTRIQLAGEVERSSSNIIAGITAAPLVLHTR